MKKTILSLSVAAALSVPGLAAAQAKSAHTFTGNIGLVTDYRFRGISQTFRKPALQGGVDYSHSSGIYLGNWNSNVNEGAGFPEAKLEMDFYGGWKGTFGDFGVDLGAIYYYYPSSNASATAGTAIVNPRTGATHTGRVDNTELYIGGSWKWLSLKYYHAIDDYFSQPGTRGSNYWDLGANYDLGNGWGIVGHVGKLQLKGWHAGTDASDGSYTDWKIGVTKDISGWVFGAAYVDTKSKGSCSAANPGYYCFADRVPNAGIGTGTASFKDAGKATIVLSVSKSF
jgi:uncharacterized protein (TIGR02001 family)